MRALLATAGLVLAFTTLPFSASAQSITPHSLIGVTGKFQKAWEKGSKLEAEGLGDLEKARGELVRYSSDVVDTQNRLDSSRARSENESAEFRKLTANPTSFRDAEEALRWARQVENAANQWAKHEDKRGDGRRDLERAMKKQRQAQAAVEQAEAKVDRGRSMKAEAERLSSVARRN